MNAAAIRVLFDYNAWANAQVWACVKDLSAEQFTATNATSNVSIRDALVRMVETDAFWFALVRGGRVPSPLKPSEYPTAEDVSRVWSVIYSDLSLVLEHLSDDKLNDEITYYHLGQTYTHTARQVLLHLLNDSTATRAHMLFAINRLGLATPEQDFVYYLRDELPPRGMVHIQSEVIRELFDYETYANSRFVSQGLANLTEAQLDHDFGYSHGTIRQQLAHILISTQYWLERAYRTEVPDELSALLDAGATLTGAASDRDMVEPVEYTSGGGVETANLRWEMLWNLVNHSTDHRAQTLAFIEEIGGHTFDQSLIEYLRATVD